MSSCPHWAQVGVSLGRKVCPCPHRATEGSCPIKRRHTIIITTIYTWDRHNNKGGHTIWAKVCFGTGWATANVTSSACHWAKAGQGTHIGATIRLLPRHTMGISLPGQGSLPPTPQKQGCWVVWEGVGVAGTHSTWLLHETPSLPPTQYKVIIIHNGHAPGKKGKVNNVWAGHYYYHIHIRGILL